MEIIGIIAEYSPFHNGHIYQINKIKKKYPDSLIIVILNGYFLERGLISLETKEEKTRLALEYGVDLVIELPFFFGSNSADIFASTSLELLHELKATKLIFGSESNDLGKLFASAKIQLDESFDIIVGDLMSSGINYPTALNKATKIDIKEPNDLLGVSYIKAILKNNYDITVETIKRTNDYHDTTSNKKIISASNIREKLKDNKDISNYIPEGNLTNIDGNLLFKILKYKILTDDNLNEYLSVDEGLDKKLKKVILSSNNIDELIKNTKSKRYTYNRLRRMLIHILVGVKKSDKETITHNEYIHILGFNNKGSAYINKIKKEVNIPLITKFSTFNSLIKDYEIKAALCYQLLTDAEVTKFEYQNKPIIKD